MKNNVLTALLLLVLVIEAGNAQNTSGFFAKADSFFNTHVKNGLVDYKAIKANPTALNGLLDMAKDISVSTEESTTYQAFWINAYNLAVIKGVVENYPIKSPLDEPGFFDKTTYAIGGLNSTLNDIENKLLRGNFPKEARFHFVLVCAGLGCPPIIDSSYKPESLEDQLQRQTELSLNDPNFIRVKNDKVLLSQLFEWYRGDFTQDGMSEIDYVNQYRKEKITPDSKVGYYSYNWSLNEH